VAEMIARCRSGPSAARVEHIGIEESAEAPPQGFETRPTA
jgi:hypothetical protein